MRESDATSERNGCEWIKLAKNLSEIQYQIKSKQKDYFLCELVIYIKCKHNIQPIPSRRQETEANVKAFTNYNYPEITK